MEHAVDRFINFGAVADKENRKKVAATLYNNLLGSSNEKLECANEELSRFIPAIETILENKNLMEICKNNEVLSEKITLDILDFVVQTKKENIQLEYQFDEEANELDTFNQTVKREFTNQWQATYSFVNKNYSSDQLDANFYQVEFKKSLSTAKIMAPYRWDFESVKEHFSEKWTALFLRKKIQIELDYIEQQRQHFSKELYDKVEQLQKIEEIFEPFTSHFGRFWDTSNGHWQKMNFDILKHYAALLEKDKSILALSDMLGKMQQAEKELEEQLCMTTTLKTQWKVNHASKSDLIGIHESDDLSSLLPSEIAYLSDETMQTIFVKKYAEKKLQTFEYQAKTAHSIKEEIEEKQSKEKQTKKGPFIVCVDTSGSMHGMPETIAKTMCFALTKLALKENRKCYLISFSTQIETLNLTDIKNSLPKFMEFLSMSFNGGTDATPAIEESLKMLTTADYKKADVLMISDFIMPQLNTIQKNKIQIAKENGTKFNNLVIGNFANENLVNDFDNNWVYNPNSENTIISLVKNINQLNK